MAALPSLVLVGCGHHMLQARRSPTLCVPQRLLFLGRYIRVGLPRALPSCLTVSSCSQSPSPSLAGPQCRQRPIHGRPQCRSMVRDLYACSSVNWGAYSHVVLAHDGVVAVAASSNQALVECASRLAHDPGMRQVAVNA